MQLILRLEINILLVKESIYFNMFTPLKGTYTLMVVYVASLMLME